jgi:hypothetical protein
MKNIIYTICFFTLIVLFVPSSVAHADITTSLQGWWKLDDGSGTTTIDSSGNGNTGTFVGSPTWIAGHIGTGALSFSGSGQYVKVPSNSSLNASTSVTVSGWFKSTNTGWNAIVARITPGPPYPGYWLTTEGTDKLCFIVGSTGFTFYNVCQSSSPYNDGNWHLAVGVFDGTTQYVYLDGVEVASGTAASGKNISNTTSDLWIGNDATTDPMHGSIDDVRMYNRALTATDVAELYAYPPASVTGVMSSTNYTLQSDSINFAGRNSVSANYTLEDTAGEVGTGVSSSTNYTVNAGYQQMQTVAISVVPPTNVTMSPALGGVTGGTSNGSTNFIVTTDDPAGYTSTIVASSSPALVNTASSTVSFADYAPVGSAPDFSFSITPNESAFAFSVFGADADQRFKNNGSSCNTGSNNTVQTCWDGLATSAKTLAGSTVNNQPSGTETTLYFRAGVGSSRNQLAGNYVATTTITVIPL